MSRESYPDNLVKRIRTATEEFCAGNSIVAKAQAPGVISTFPRGEKLFSVSLGFSGPMIKGALLLTSNVQSITASFPQKAVTPTQDQLADWIGETANQVVGNLKRLLAGYKADFFLSTPTVVQGLDIVVAAQGDKVPLLGFEFVGPTYRLHVFFKAEIDPKLSFEGEPAETGQAKGGEAMLF